MKYDTRTERTLHIFSHHIDKDLPKLRATFKEFATKNYKWIEKVGEAVLWREKLSSVDFVNGICNGIIPFNELALLVTCRALNIHCVVLLKETYFSTQSMQKIDQCFLKLAYVGNYTFKELSTETAPEQLSETEPKDTSNDSSDFSDDGLESDKDDLEGTGLLGNQNSEHEDSGIENNEQEQEDVKPLLRALINFDSTLPIVIDSDSDVEPSKVTNGQDKAEAIDTTNADVDSDCFIESFQPGNPPKQNVDRVVCERKYTCYLCQETFTMQKSFILHFQEKHPDDLFQCEYCQSQFKMANGLFKHERSHEYLKHTCPFCSKKFQFPYQLAHHKRQHTGIGRIGCTKCPKTFGAKCLRDFHEKTHGVFMKCQLCPMTSTKTFSSKITLNLHERGMHGPGWDTPCGDKHYKWKSSYTHHVLNCKKCTKIHADQKLKRFNFLKTVVVKEEH